MDQPFRGRASVAEGSELRADGVGIPSQASGSVLEGTVAGPVASPAGHDHWTLRLLAGKVVELGLAASFSYEGIRKRLKKKRPQAIAEEGVVYS